MYLLMPCDMEKHIIIYEIYLLKNILKAMPDSTQIFYLTSGLEDKQGLEEELNYTKKKQQANSNYDIF